MPGAYSTRGGPGPSNKKRLATRTPANEVIVISDTEEDVKPNIRATKKRASNSSSSSAGKRARTSIASDYSGIEVIEPPEDPPHVKELKTRASAAEHSRRQLEKQVAEQNLKHKSCERVLKDENTRLRQERDESREKEKRAVARAQTAEQALTSDPNNGVNTAALEECVSCEICQEKMWSPWMLSECGHVYCQTCLIDWFGTVHAKHLEAHPAYDVNVAPPLTPVQLARIPIQIRAYVTLSNDPPRPAYTCPTCRALITRKPSEAYVVKSIVELIAKTTGEKKPSTTTPAATATRSSRSGKSKAPAAPAGPWDGFFGRA